MTLHRFHALALTPIHVGDGSTWTPESFKLDGNHLVLFEPTAALAALDPAGCTAFSRAIESGELRKAQQLLQSVVRGELELGRIAMAASSREEIGIAIDNPARAGRIHPFVRTAGRPFLPGSAIKGAIRTAILSTRAQPRISAFLSEIAQANVRSGKSGRVSDSIQRQVFDLGPDQRKTDTDPFRHVAVADCILPPGATRIDRVHNLRRDGQPNAMQMHFEALLAGTGFVVEMNLADERANRAAAKDRAKTARQPILIDELRQSLDLFYRGIWDAEAGRFYARGGLPELPPASEATLLRVGRFSHFEAASIEGLRQGYRPQSQAAKTAPEGSTRMVTIRDEVKIPFGWVALFADQAAAERWGLRIAAATRPSSRPAASVAKPSSSATTQSPASGARLTKFRIGDRVMDAQGEIATVIMNVPLGAQTMDVEFQDGSRETVRIGGWTRA